MHINFVFPKKRAASLLFARLLSFCYCIFTHIYCLFPAPISFVPFSVKERNNAQREIPKAPADIKERIRLLNSPDNERISPEKARTPPAIDFLFSILTASSLSYRKLIRRYSHLRPWSQIRRFHDSFRPDCPLLSNFEERPV